MLSPSAREFGASYAITLASQTDAMTLADNADLYDAGMTSHASVSLMLALEDEFDVEFPDELLTRSVFSSIESIKSAILGLAPVDHALNGGGVVS